MAGLFGKIAKLASSPQGRAAIEKAKAAANDPKNRAKLDQAIATVKSKGASLQRPAGTTPASNPPATAPPAPAPQTEVRAEQLPDDPAPAAPPTATPAGPPQTESPQDPYRP